jgi:hypothetical protein
MVRENFVPPGFFVSEIFVVELIPLPGGQSLFGGSGLFRWFSFMLLPLVVFHGLGAGAPFDLRAFRESREGSAFDICFFCVTSYFFFKLR